MFLLLIERKAHSDFAVGASLTSCAIICFLQLFWGRLVVYEVFKMVVGGSGTSSEKKKKSK
jgi:hypothetical protein